MDRDGFWHLQDVAREDPIQPGEPLRGTLVHRGEHSSTNVLQFAPDGVLKPHFHREHDEIAYVVKGEADFRLGDDHIRAMAGDIMITPAGTVHAATARGSDLLVLAIFVPAFDPEHPDRVFVEA